ncbi:MAG: YkgJ family cysteine cluster protein [Aquimonas sp.]|nr:YkgJ family cysteine cluster protein [Aquimonas sp.]
MTELMHSLRAQAQSSADESSSRELLAGRGPERARRQVLRSLQQALDRLPPGPKPACAAGCALCCHLRVAVTPVEVFGLLDHLRANATPEGFAALAARVEQTAARVHALQPAQRLATNIPCPVLVDGRCSGYSGRPLNCRAYHSLDLAACETSFARPEDASLGHPQDAAVARVHEGTQAGFLQALRGAGLDAAQYELATALAEALVDPAARRRFEAGGQAFLKAVRL